MIRARNVTQLSFVAISVLGVMVLPSQALAQDSDVPTEEILVVGQKASQAASIEQERASDSLKSIVASDQIGNFPDQNVAESLQRLPGISVTRDQGEGRFPVVRGADPNFNAVTINGVRVPSPVGTERSVPLDVIPADLLETLEVTKTLTPDIDGDSIGGSINIRSLTAFDRGGYSLQFRGEARYNEQSEEMSPKGSVTWTNLFDFGNGSENFGIAASISYSQREAESDNIEADGPPELTTDTTGDFFAFGELEQRAYEIDRDRLGATLSFDYRPTDSASYYLKFLHSDFEDVETRRRNEVGFGRGDLVPGTLGEGTGQFTDTRVDREYRTRKIDQTISSYVLGGENVSDDWVIDYSVAYSLAETDVNNRIDATFRTGGIDIGYIAGTTSAQYINAEPDFFSGDAFPLEDLELRQQDTEDDETAIRLNFERMLEWGGKPASIKFGGAIRMRDKSANEDREVFDDFDALGGPPLLTQFIEGEQSGFDLGVFGPRISASGLADYFFSNLDTLRATGLDTGGTLEDSNVGDYSSSEDVTALYLMGTVDLSDTVRLIGGVRYEDTDFETQGKIVDIENETVAPAPTVSNSYSNVLPSLHLRWDVSDTVVVRASYAASLIRPLFDQSASRLIDDDGDVFAGNPELDPIESQAFDLSLAWYPEGLQAAVGIGVFYKQLDDFIVQADVLGVDPDFPLSTGFNEVIKAINGDEADVLGFEIYYQQSFDNLPAPWDGFLISANAAFIDSEADLGSIRNGEKIPLPRQSDTVGNLSIGYEKNRWSLRASMAYRDAYLDLLEDPSDSAADNYARDHTQLDFTVKYDLTDSFTVYLEHSNANDEALSVVYGGASSRFLRQYEVYGYTTALGVQGNF
ncbi:MAG: TonB-dependent receptor [Woeseiaceae bacterium]|nr:TonB-dependent receptor [Woeseiaceae bacterium]